MKIKERTLLSYLLLTCFTFLALGVVTHAGWVTIFDQTISQATAKLINPTNTSFFKIMADLGSPVVAISLTIALASYIMTG